MLTLEVGIQNTHIMQQIDIRPMAALHLVGQSRSFSLAAQALGSSQPTLSRLIAGAEAELGVALFRRGWSGAEPTPEGEVVLTACSLGMAALRQAEATLYVANRPHPALQSALKLADLAAVRAVVETGSTRLAAQRLGLGQPEVSRTLAQLAARLSLDLFRRHSRGMAAQEPALILARLSGALQSPFDRLGERMRLPPGEISGRVALGMLPFSGQAHVARAFALLSNRHPRLRLTGVPGSYHGLIEALRRHEIDRIIGILRHQDCPPDLAETPLYDEEFTVIARTGHPALNGPQRLCDLARLNWVVAPVGTPVRAHFERIFAAEGLAPPTQSVEMLSFEAAEQVLAASNSLGMLTYSPARLRQLRPDLGQVDLPGPRGQATIGLTGRADAPGDPALAAFEQALAEVLAAGNEQPA